MSPHSPKVYRGSKKRIRRIRMRGNGSVALWVFVAVVLFSLFFALPWMVLNHPPETPVHGNAIQAR
jgi:hypothetical protein